MGQKLYNADRAAAPEWIAAFLLTHHLMSDVSCPNLPWRGCPIPCHSSGRDSAIADTQASGYPGAIPALSRRDARRIPVAMGVGVAVAVAGEAGEAGEAIPPGHTAIIRPGLVIIWLQRVLTLLVLGKIL